MIDRLLVIGALGVALISFILFTGAAFGQALHSHDDPVGRRYKTWKRPDARNVDGVRIHSCCNEKDCAPADVVAKNGRLYARNHPMAPGQDVELPPELFEHRQPDPHEMPDDRNHVCILPVGGFPPVWKPKAVCVWLAPGL